MLSPADFGLQDNPFSLVPSAEVENWAGMPKTKEALADVVASVRPDDVGSSECVVIHGDYGAGKSHALRYFAHQINTEQDSLAIYMSEVVTGAAPKFSELCKGICEQLKDEPTNHIAKSVDAAIKKCADRLAKEKDINISSQMAIEQAVPKQDRYMVKHLCDKQSIPDMGKEDHAAATQLASLFRVMTSAIDGDLPPYSAVYLFLDEMEHVFEAKAAAQIQFFSALRILINAVNEHFAMVLSFSAPTAVLEAAVPEYLKERMTRQYIGCEKLGPEEAQQFTQDFLRQIRIDSFSAPDNNPYYPFSEGAIEVIFERETTLVPRRILQAMRRIWERAVRREGLEKGEAISKEMAEEILISGGL